MNSLISYFTYPFVFLSFKQDSLKRIRSIDLIKENDSLKSLINGIKIDDLQNQKDLYSNMLEHTDQQINWFLIILGIVGIIFTFITTIFYFMGWKSIKNIAKEYLKKEMNKKIIVFEKKLKQKEKDYHKEVNLRISSLESEIKLNNQISNLFDDANKYSLGNDTYNEIRTYNKILELDKNNVRAKGNKGCALIKYDKNEEAIKYFDEILKSFPDDPIAWNNKGVAMGNLKKYEDELLAYKKVIELDSSFASAYYNIACSFSLQGKPLNEIKVYLQKAFRLDEKLKMRAKSDEDFDLIKHQKGFKDLLND